MALRTRVRILAFDADGVVIVPPHRFMAYLERELNVDSAVSGAFFRGAFRDCLTGRADLREVIAPVLPGWGWRGTVEDLLRRWFQEEHYINEPLVEAVQALRRRGFRAVVVTNQEKYRLSYMRSEMGFDRLFDGVFGSAEVGAAKPVVEFYERVTRRLGVPPGEVVFWDDTEANVEAARSFGWRAERFTDMDAFRRTLRAHVGVV